VPGWGTSARCWQGCTYDTYDIRLGCRVAFIRLDISLDVRLGYLGRKVADDVGSVAAPEGAWALLFVHAYSTVYDALYVCVCVCVCVERERERESDVKHRHVVGVGI